MSDIVKFENVVKEYKSGEHILTAIDHINFTIEEGEFVVILGPSGAGKSFKSFRRFRHCHQW